MNLHRPPQILFRFFLGLHNNVVVQWVEYFHKILNLTSKRHRGQSVPDRF